MASSSLFFGSLNPPVGRLRRLSPRVWTVIGALAIPLWATWPALGWRSLEMPAFECLAIAYLCGWLVMSILEGYAAKTESESTFLQSWVPPFMLALALAGNGALHLFATHYIPAAEANLISYLWPVEIVVLASVLGLFKLRAIQLMGLALGLIGAVVLIGGQPLTMSYKGIGLAFLSGLSWALYCVFRLRWTVASSHVVSRGLGISTLVCAVLHFAIEPTTLPSPGGLLSAAAVGIVPTALGNWVWDEGFRRGDSQLLAVMAYATPLCSALLLAALGMEVFTLRLFIGGAVIVSAGVLSRT